MMISHGWLVQNGFILLSSNCKDEKWLSFSADPNYYGKYRKWKFLNIFQRLSFRLMQWVQNKYKFDGLSQGYQWLRNYQREHPKLFAHWRVGFKQ